MTKKNRRINGSESGGENKFPKVVSEQDVRSKVWIV
jgi:hypothetical protein